jgi:hypothetical protein
MVMALYSSLPVAGLAALLKEGGRRNGQDRPEKKNRR